MGCAALRANLVAYQPALPVAVCTAEHRNADVRAADHHHLWHNRYS
jgi:hypothetical protein